ncbi:MAG: glycosyltransferase [Chitinophagaceae bacterium]|nr:glycosyltransferase [Chitinophagaceae bacterium]
MNFKSAPIQPPTKKEKIALRAMIFIGFFSVGFFLYTMFQHNNIGYKPLYVLLMITMGYYCLKYMHEWYHYFSISVTAKPQATKIYTIDVLTTYCAGEPQDMLEETLTAIQKMTYPHTAWCCDEADDPNVKAMCQRLGVRHITRTIKVNAKAGNINNALKQATGELCLVMDPDHIPAPDFLDAVVGYFEDPKVGYVQIVQGYYNQQESLVAKGAAQQTYQFYGPMMMCMNTYGTVQAIGANCTFRRSALDSIGGHAAGLSEDMPTAMQMHAKGWKSIYMPSILTRGLVPATLSSYYKQQLKWSRGTWELLMVTYPKLFTKFTWRQRLHYFLLPFHYLCGIIFFINFLIPVISLVTGYIPLKMDIIAFLLASLPMLAMSVFIRHFVQKWVAEETERGFHIVGGILQIGAWWVHSIGFIYTILRKKVPYIPTPKNDNDPLPLALNIPNIFIAGVSLGAIIYGFTNNYNPYTVFMAALASMQIFFMIFIFSISGYTNNDSKVSSLAKKIRRNTWLIVQTHGFLRKYSVILAVLVVTGFIFGYRKMQELPTFLPKPLPDLEVFYKGVFEPADSNGHIAVTNVLNENKNAAIIGFSIDGSTTIASDSLQAVYKNKAVPVITWKPFKNNAGIAAVDDGLMQDVATGKHDEQLHVFAKQLAALGKPAFINLSFEGNIKDTLDKLQPQLFILAWQHIHDVFYSAGADKAVWVWSHWNAATVQDYFPGRKYVDWLGAKALDNNIQTNSTDKQGFYSAYYPYHRLPLFKSGLPVMITEAGTLAANKTLWWKVAENNIDTAFNEIKSVIAVNDAVGYLQSGARFMAGNTNTLFQQLAGNNFEKDITGSSLPEAIASTNQYILPDTLRGIVYDKGYFWFRNRHTMSRKTIEYDISEIKKIGVNTVERTLPGFYDEIIDKVLRKNSIKQIARFVTLIGAEELDDKVILEKEKQKILAVVKNNLGKTNIIAWNLGSDVLFNLENQTFKPGNFYYRNKYVTWLSDLCNAIRAIDPVRPIITDLNWDVNGEKRLQFYKRYVPQINKYMLTATAKNKPGLKQPLTAQTAWGKVPVELWDSLTTIKKAGFIPAWQDIENTDFITLNGLLDLEGRHKHLFRKVVNTWTSNKVSSSPIPDIKILRPAKTTRENISLSYNVMIRKDSTQWSLFKEQIQGLHFEWYLVRVDQYGNTMFIKKAGEGSSITLPIPKEPQYYELIVEAVLGKDIRVARSTLNTPLE